MNSKKQPGLPADTDGLLREALELERTAQKFLSEQNPELAYEAHRKAAVIFSEIGKSEQAGFCYTQAASCWNKHIGQLPVSKAADANEHAAFEFLRSGNYHYAMIRFSDAALLYEREGNYSKFSNNFYAAKRAEGQHAWEIFLLGKGLFGNFFEKLKERMSGFFRAVTNFSNCLLWGYGERPFRTFGSAAGLILLCAFIYHRFGPIQTQLGARAISFGEGLYLSMITFATVGYGDYLPLSLITRITAVVEAFSGILLMPLFLIALTRRYLRASH